MAITYTKPLKTVVITTLSGNSVTVTDTVDLAAASQAFRNFEHHETVVVLGDGEIDYIPFHAIEAVVVTVEASDEQTRVDPYCVEADVESGS